MSNYSVKSTTAASGAFLATEAIPFSHDAFDVYISLEPIICPFVAVRLKKKEPSFAVLR